MDVSLQRKGDMALRAREFVASLVPRGHALVVALSGELGAGKTTFAQEIARALGVAESVTSPTFVIEKVYALAGQKWSRLVHIDAYRLASGRELEALGFRELLADPANLILVEWPERVPTLIPEDAVRVSLSFVDENSRHITYG
jgi:tRNA threonylcarbamoyladenosine biosynthesis protein TsaE